MSTGAFLNVQKAPNSLLTGLLIRTSLEKLMPLAHTLERSKSLPIPVHFSLDAYTASSCQHLHLTLPSGRLLLPASAALIIRSVQCASAPPSSTSANVTGPVHISWIYGLSVSVAGCLSMSTRLISLKVNTWCGKISFWSMKLFAKQEITQMKLGRTI